MTKAATTKRPRSRANARSDEAPPVKPKRVRVKLQTIDDIKAEMARLYRQARAGAVRVEDASRLANMLSIHGRLIEGSENEARLKALEEAMADPSDGVGRE